jgi:adenylate kinase family enzyme
MDLSIIIIGKICSGKSTLAADFSKWLKFPIASFGGYLSTYSKVNNLPINREALQNLGTDFINADHVKFLKSVIEFTDPAAKNLIFEGVRHKVILDEIRRTSGKSYSIFLDARKDIRLQRFIGREKEIDTQINAELDFNERSMHPVEMELDDLKDQCNFVISTNESYREFLSTLSLFGRVI